MGGDPKKSCPQLSRKLFDVGAEKVQKTCSSLYFPWKILH